MPNKSPDLPVKVILVDDEENILRSLRRLIMDEEYEVFTATSGAKGLEITKENPDVALIVSDQRMPEMTGVEFLEKTRKLAPNASRILLTGYADINAAVDAINLGGAYKYITKPWQDDDLLQSIREAVNRNNLIRENIRLNQLVKAQNIELKNWSSDLEIMVQEQTMELKKSYDEQKGLNAKLKDNFKNSIIAFSGLLEMRDKTMRSHSRNVAKIAGSIAKRIRMTSEEMENLVIAAILHDIGKIGVSDINLKLDYEELETKGQEEYRSHPIRGQAAIDNISDLRKAGVIIRHHHERYDGKGFPDQLGGEEIPMGARIIAIADYVDKTIRRYEGDSGIELTIKKALEKKASFFDPVLLKLIDEPIRETYKEQLPKTDIVEMELYPDDLKAGMILGRDVTSGTGLLLISKGTVLNDSTIAMLARHHAMDPYKTAISVWRQKRKID